MKLLNDGGCRFETQGQWLEDIRGSTARGCSDCYDGGSDVENGVTPIKTRLLRKIKTRLLRKGQSSGFDTMLEILNSTILYFIVKECT